MKTQASRGEIAMKHPLPASICVLLILAALLMLPSGDVSAMVERIDLADLVAKATSILVGDVIRLESHWNESQTMIFTDVTLAVKTYVKGPSEKSEVIIQIPGGRVDEVLADVSDVPVFSVNEKVVVFLREEHFQVVGWYQGKFSVKDDIVLEKSISLDKFLQQIREIDVAQQRGAMPPADPSAQIEAVGILAVPQISRITPNSGPARQRQPGTTGRGTCPDDATAIVVDGANFGSTQGTSRIRFWRQNSEYYNACIDAWGDTQIRARVPGGVSSGNVVVITNGGTSNGVQFSVTFSYGGARWNPGASTVSVPFRVNANTRDVEGELGAVRAAANTWNSPTGISFSFQYSGTCSTSAASRNSENCMAWIDQDTGAIATCTTWSTGNQITEFDIVFNDRNYNWGTDGSSSRMDVQHVATHELGHALGLLDLYGSADSQKTMYGYSSNGATNQRTLEADDIAGLRYIYPRVEQPPSAPSNLRAVAASASQINLTWQDNANNETGFKIERKTGSGGSWGQIATVGANVTSYASTGLTAGTTYYYRVRATNGAGDSGYSNEASATTAGAPPSAPSNLRAVAASASQVNLTWQDNANNETGFKIERKTGSGGGWGQIATVGANVTSYASTGLAAGTTYYYRVRATNGAGDSGYSNEASATTQSAARNLALNRPAWATSQQSSTYAPGKGNDGSTSTRWSSRVSSTLGDEWWRVDMGGQTYDRVVIRWEAAYAARHYVGWSTDGTNFTGSWYSISSAGVYGYQIGSRNARYIAVLMRTRAPRMNNYSFYEFEVYNGVWPTAAPIESTDSEAPDSPESAPVIEANPESLSVPEVMPALKPEE
jgi:hypothetical protein